MKKERAKIRRGIGGDICWASGEEDVDIIRDREICKVLRKIGVLQISPIGNMFRKGVRWRINIPKILEICGIESENG